MKKPTAFMIGLTLAALLPAAAAASQSFEEGPMEALTEELSEESAEELPEELPEELTEQEAAKNPDAGERFSIDPAGFILDEMKDECFASIFEDETLVCFGEVPGEDLAMLGISKNGETSFYGGGFSLEGSRVTVTDCFGGGEIAFSAGHAKGCPFVIVIADEETGEESCYDMWPAPAGMLAAQARRTLADEQEMTRAELEALCREDPLYALMAGIDSAWVKEESDEGEILYGLSADGEFSCRVSIRPDGEILLRTGNSFDLPKPPGDLAETDPLLPGRMMLYTDDYLDYVIGASYAEEETDEYLEEMTEEFTEEMTEEFAEELTEEFAEELTEEG